MTETMRAVVQRGYGSPDDVLELTEIERPVPGAGEVLVRLHATSVNTPDWILVTGTPAVLRLGSGLRRPSAPVRGSDIGGTVAAVGPGVTDLAPGEAVFGSGWRNRAGGGAGTFAEYTVAPADQLLRKPAELPFAEAAAAVMSGITALTAVRDVIAAGPGTRLLINGASGGVGTFAVQIAARLGARVTAVCSGRNAEFARSLGAERVIDHTVEDYTRGAERYDAILDNVLNHPPAASARMLTPTGVYVPNSVGAGSRLLAGLPRMARAATLLRLTGTRVRTVTCVPNRENLAAVAEQLGSGEVTAIVERSYPLGEATSAVAHMLGHRARGNIVITL
ncbi:NAD(P)-dependent alcohol dehydrogenase [Nocardia asteroides]|uniref:NAD(P)-dependent alcohol dehydrogenase n=1 Tax=Nocardia asteroides TaxID=1824 RepID=UPI001E525EB7|nr:NAD(P)-dependent alcohol dehydrogenase [Nocardia asteroides]UGT62720.1 NAD(P)-dependent alcohol dehydrogenase [Nocardia asteroides]